MERIAHYNCLKVAAAVRDSKCGRPDRIGPGTHDDRDSG
jgi:hypothetical protein